MRRKRLLWQLYPSFLVVTLLAVLVVAGHVTQQVDAFYTQQVASDLRARAALVTPPLADAVAAGDPARADALAKSLGRRASTRITVIAPDGLVVGDTERDPATMVNHLHRPEVQEAIVQGVGSRIRYSRTLKRPLMYVAVPVYEGDDLAGVVRTAIPVTDIRALQQRVHVQFGIGALVIMLLSFAVSIFNLRRLSRALDELKRGAERFARGQLLRFLPVPEEEELAGLALAMNEMAAQLDDRMRTVVKQRNELEAVLSGMVEGVLVVDSEQRLLNLNRAAAELLDIDPDEALGLGIHGVVRNTGLQRFVARALASPERVEADLVLQNDGERYIQAHGTLLHDDLGHALGALVVLNDVTRLRRLENLRRDFVANVSHELRTPITSVKGFAETLLEGALDEPDDARRFAEIIHRQADRLNNIVEDLLTLSRVEQEGERAEIALESGKVAEVVQAAATVCGVQAEEKGIAIELDIDGPVEARINAPLLEEAVINLVDNAIKYSEPGSRVLIRAWRDPDGIRIAVQDQGSGIADEHLPRLFERFYRVDKARSRKLGGTGLGLAIVKHIVSAHGGRVTVDTRLGEGSTFTLHLPAFSADPVAPVAPAAGAALG